MTDRECVEFLQWALPRLRMRWSGFRKVRGQVCKRVRRRIAQLRLVDPAGYRGYLESHVEEWDVLDSLCRITISRFCRDQGVFTFLERDVFPRLARMALEGREPRLRVLSAGCGAGEEPYTVNLLWRMRLRSLYPRLGCAVFGIDSDPNMIRRCNAACYGGSSLRDLPDAWRIRAFEQRGNQHCLRTEYRAGVEFAQLDLRNGVPDGPFHMLLCRNLAFTYWEEELQVQVAQDCWDALVDDGALVVGVHEEVPGRTRGFEAWADRCGVYRKTLGD